MSVFLVRHAKAGSRSEWDGPDELRPISKKGRRQADALVPLLRHEHVKRIVTSPYLRCVETVEPLAAALGLEVERHDALAEGAPVAASIALFDEVAGDNGVLCSHGDVIPAVLERLQRRDGLAVPAAFPFAKGSVWVVDGTAPPFVHARYVPPPA